MHHGQANGDVEQNYDEYAEDAEVAPFCLEIIGWTGKLLQKLVARCLVSGAPVRCSAMQLGFSMYVHPTQ